MKTLIVYATKHGATAKCSEILSRKFPGKVDLHNLKVGSFPDISQYDRVVIGGSIYAGKIQNEVTEFCQKNLSTLKQKKLGLFICCMNQNATDTQLNTSFPKELLHSATAKDSFGGEFNFSEMNFMEKAITKMVSKTLAKNSGNSSSIDTKKNISMISEENINRFAEMLA